MPCYKCANGKYKYGQRGNCQFDTLDACKQAEQAIHARENAKEIDMAKKPYDKEPMKPEKKPDKKKPAKM
jgi:hypothetical protein